MKVDRKETLRYLGYGRQEADGQALQLLEEVAAELEADSIPKSIYREYGCQVEGDKVLFGGLAVTSASLARNLKGCGRVVLLAATIGRTADLMIKKYSVLNLAKAAIVQAAGAAYIESYLDEISAEIKKDAQGRGLYLRPRFSPGYGDLSLSCQPDLLQELEAGKRIGIKLTESLLMTPSKSVSAVVGVSKKPHRCEVKGCEACGKTDCLYRRI